MTACISVNHQEYRVTTYLPLHLIANKTVVLVYETASECTTLKFNKYFFLNSGEGAMPPPQAPFPIGRVIPPPHILPLGALHLDSCAFGARPPLLF